jgi:hypothetical protein
MALYHEDHEGHEGQGLEDRVGVREQGPGIEGEGLGSGMRRGA